MAWFVIVVLAVVLLLVLLTLAALASSIGDETESERARIEFEMRRAERHLHRIARDSFAAMLEEARARDRR